MFPSVSYAFHHSPPGGGEVQAAQDAASESAAQCADAPYVPAIMYPGLNCHQVKLTRSLHL